MTRRQKGLVKQLPSMNPRLRQQPIFCMETALKMVLWSSLVYESECSEGNLPALGSQKNVETLEEEPVNGLQNSHKLKSDPDAESGSSSNELEKEVSFRRA